MFVVLVLVLVLILITWYKVVTFSYEFFHLSIEFFFVVIDAYQFVLLLAIWAVCFFRGEVIELEVVVAHNGFLQYLFYEIISCIRIKFIVVYLVYQHWCDKKSV